MNQFEQTPVRLILLDELRCFVSATHSCTSIAISNICADIWSDPPDVPAESQCIHGPDVQTMFPLFGSPSSFGKPVVFTQRKTGITWSSHGTLNALTVLSKFCVSPDFFQKRFEIFSSFLQLKILSKIKVQLRLPISKNHQTLRSERRVNRGSPFPRGCRGCAFGASLHQSNRTKTTTRVYHNDNNINRKTLRKKIRHKKKNHGATVVPTRIRFV